MLDKPKAYWKTNTGRLVLVMVPVITFCVCCAFFAALSPSDNNASLSDASVQSTANAFAVTSVAQTQVSEVTATQEPTATLANTSTPEPTVAPEIQTQQAQATMAAEIAAYVAMDPRELLTYPKDHIGEQIFITGRIFNINDNTQLQMYVGDGLDAVYVVMAEPFNGIYEDDRIKVYGLIAGENCGENAFGGEVCQPLLIDAFFEKQ